MKTYFRLLEYVRPYWRKVILLFVTVTIFASLSGISLTLIHPFLRIILYEDHGAPREQVEASASDSPRGVQGIPLPAQVETLKANVQSWFEARMYAGDAKTRLSRFCVFLLLLFLVKNIFLYCSHRSRDWRYCPSPCSSPRRYRQWRILSRPPSC